MAQVELGPRGKAVWRLPDRGPGMSPRDAHPRIALTARQWVGIPPMVLLPLVALAGWLGPDRGLVVGRVALIYCIMLVSFRILGKRELSQMTPFETVLVFLIPQTFRNYLVGTDSSLETALVAATTLFSLVFFTSLFGFRSQAVGKLVKAEPSVLVEQGQLIERELNRERITVDDILAALRRAGYDGLAQARRVTLEADGKMSVVPQSPGREPTIPTA
jgi:uncharacterized membrane protein YcaP (DUF421 family)